MAEAEGSALLGAFDGTRVRIPDGSATPHTKDGRPMIRIEPDDPSAGAEEVPVSLVLGSGRQHQVYLARDATTGSLALLPLIWTTPNRRWIPMASYQRSSADPKSPNHWRHSDPLELGCLGCHLSQARVTARDRRVEWAELPVNCEACHGPGRTHVSQRRAGREDDSYRDLHAVSTELELAVCAQCHARKSGHLFPIRGEDGEPYTPMATVALPAFRADGTQLVTGYQVAGHLLSRCHSRGGVTCSACHEPHAGTPRDLLGQPAKGSDSNKQCTLCHRDRIDPRAAKKHAHHESVSCIDCHMPKTWMMDDPKLVQRVADHSISIPRPRESLEIGSPNACTTCHRDKTDEWALAQLLRWGARRATEVRTWVRALDRAKRSADARSELASVLSSSDAAELPFLRMSALDALIEQAPFPAVVPAIEQIVERTRDPETRALGILALIRHDPARATGWRDRGLADHSPLVRAEVLLGDPQGDGLDEASVERVLGDIAALDALPSDSYRRIAALLLSSGRHDAASVLNRAADALAVPALR
jgi:hypothetical protein